MTKLEYQIARGIYRAHSRDPIRAVQMYCSARVFAEFMAILAVCTL